MVMHPRAYAVAYQTAHSTRRLLTPSFQSAELALQYLYDAVDSWHSAVVVAHTDQTYGAVDSWHMAVVKTVTHTDHTRHS